MLKIYTNSKDQSYSKVKLSKVNIDVIKDNNKIEITINPTTLTSKQTIIYALELIKAVILLNIKNINSPRKVILNIISNSLNKLSNKLKVE